MRRGLECVYDRPCNPALALMPGACESKLDQIGKDISSIQAALGSLLKQRSALISREEGQKSPAGSPSSKTATSSSINGTFMQQDSDNESLDGHFSQVNTPRHTAMTRENSPVGRLTDDQIDLARAVSMNEPMGSLYEVTRLRNIRFNQCSEPGSERSSEGPIIDFISKGVIKEEEAERLYKIFCQSLNHYLWVGLEQIHDSLDSVRRSSTLLTATILTVTALHVPSCNETFDKCYGVFLDLISESMFARKHSIDDVRGLCIGAFWLSDVSWKLSGHAIRIATELGIHQSFYHALKGDREHFLRARLWYMLYVCDKHFSIAYGRPPMMNENVQIRDYERYLRCGLADILDYRIVSQVALFQIINRVYDTLTQPSCPQEEHSMMVPDSQLHHMRAFNQEINQWQSYWTEQMEANDYIGQFPVIGITLYSYFGKLLLNSLALRGVNMSTDKFTPERREFANCAIEAAANIVSYVLEQPDLRRAMVGTPLYVHTMITWSSVFLMKIATNWRVAGFVTEPVWIWTLVDNMIQLLQSTMISDRHVLHYIAEGLQKMLSKSRQLVMARGGLPARSQEPDGAVKYDGSATSTPTNMPIGPSILYGQPIVAHNMLQSPPSSQMLNGLTSSGWTGQYQTCGAEIQGDPTAFDQMILNSDMIGESFAGTMSYPMFDMLNNAFPSSTY